MFFGLGAALEEVTSYSIPVPYSFPLETSEA